MNLPLKIARKYLFSRKNHSVINILSAVSAAAIGVGCAALIIILSVFNGFNSLVTKMYSEGAPDFIIEPSDGKIISLGDTSITHFEDYFSQLQRDEGALLVALVEDNAYLQYGEYQQIGTIVGEPWERNFVMDSDSTVFSKSDSHNAAVLDMDIAQLLNVPQNLDNDSITIYVPTRTEDISLLAPMESVNSKKLRISEIRTIENNPGAERKFDKKVHVNIDVAQELLEYSEDEVNRLELYLSAVQDRRDNGSSNEWGARIRQGRKLKKSFQKILGDRYVVKDFYEQNATVYKMMRSEKLAVYLILFFVIIIIGVNIISSVAIMIIEKQDDIQTLKTMGAEGSLLRRAFTLHGALICMVGAVAGLVIGLIICWLQQRFGLVSLPGNFVTNVYPVSVRLGDVLIILAGILAICFSLSYIPSRFVK